MSDLFSSDPEEAQRHIELLEKRLIQFERHHIKSEKWFKLYHALNDYMVENGDLADMEFMFEYLYQIDGGVYDNKLGELTPKQEG